MLDLKSYLCVLNASVFLVYHSWQIPLVRFGWKHKLEHEDIYKTPDFYNTTLLTERLER